jgi:WD40 repeat protein
MTQFISRRRLHVAFVVAGLALEAGLLSGSISAQGVSSDGPYRLARNDGFNYASGAHVYDASLNRLYSSGTGGIYQTDLGTMKLVSRSTAIRSTGSISLDAARGELYVLALHDNAMHVMDVTTGKVIRSFDAPAWFNVVYEPTKGELYYLRGDKEEVVVADRITGKTLSTIMLPGTPAYLVADAPRHRLLIRLANRPLIQVIDTTDHTIVASWKASQDGISSMAISPDGTRVFSSAGRDITMLDGQTGKELARCHSSDEMASMAYDAQAGYLLTIAGGHYLNVAKVEGDSLKLVQSMDMRAGVQDLYLNPSTHTVFGVSRTVDENVFRAPQLPSGGGGTVLTLTLKQ